MPYQRLGGFLFVSLSFARIDGKSNMLYDDAQRRSDLLGDHIMIYLTKRNTSTLVPVKGGIGNNIRIFSISEIHSSHPLELCDLWSWSFAYHLHASPMSRAHG